jgi:predicted Zn-dependent protease with MMP-like domain
VTLEIDQGFFSATKETDSGVGRGLHSSVRRWGEQTMAYRVSKAHFGELVEEALRELPEPFATFLEEVPIEVRDRPSPRELRSLGIGGGGLLLGLYHGRPRTQRSVEDSGTLPDVIYLFQEHIEMVSDSDEQLVQQVRTTVLHEIGHYFGMSEADLDELGYG